MIWGLFYVMIGSVVIAIDRMTKIWAIIHCSSEVIQDPPFFSCHLLYNRGISWSLLHGQDTAGFIGVTALTIVITSLLFWFVLKNKNNPEWSVFGGTLAIAGSCSNIIDRILYGGVVDFILLSYKDYSYPVFNIADVCIVIGIMLIIIKNYRAS